MKIVIDECVPHIVKKNSLIVRSKLCRNWVGRGVKNGELLKLVAAEFDTFITSDKNLRFQQNLKELKLSIILLLGNQVPVIKDLLPKIDEALQNSSPGSFIEI
jgi:hypothetical protein